MRSPNVVLDMMSDELGYTLQKILSNNFCWKPEEKVILLSDYVPEELRSSLPPNRAELINERSKFVEILFLRAKDLLGTENVELVKFPCAPKSGSELPEWVLEKIKEFDIFIALTTYSVLYTEGIMNLAQTHVRGASMHGFSPIMFYSQQSLAADHSKMENLGKKIIDEISSIQQKEEGGHCTIKIVDGRENALTFDVKNRTFIGDYGLLDKPGMIGNLPAGEIYLAPDENRQANGKISIPQEWSRYVADETEFLTLYFENGALSRIDGAKDSLLEFLGFNQGSKSPVSEEIKRSRRNLAEFGIGLNPNATKHDSLLESQKILGTCHVGIGTSSTFGGNVKSDAHINFVIPGASVFVNEKPIISNGLPIFDYQSEGAQQ